MNSKILFLIIIIGYYEALKTIDMLVSMIDAESY